MTSRSDTETETTDVESAPPWEFWEITPVDLQLINKTPFLQSLLYDMDLLPEQLESQKQHKGMTERLKFAYGQFHGVLQCYRANQIDRVPG